MQTFFSLFAAFFLLLGQASALPMEGTGVQMRDTETCDDPTASTAFLRAYNPYARDHFYSTNVAEMENALLHNRYNSEGDAAYVFSSSSPSTVPLFRLYNPSIADHFYTTSQSEHDYALQQEGYSDEGIAAWVYTTEVCGSVPLFRVYSASAGDHFYTTSASERNNAVARLGYVDEGVAAYVLPVPADE